MAEPIDAALITQFSDQVHVASQQQKARLRPHVIIKPIKGEDFAYDGLDSVEAQERSGRHEPIVFSDINHWRRKIARRRFTIALPIDAADVRSMLQDPQGVYAQAVVKAMERVFDRVVTEAMFASVYTGRAMSTAVTFASDNGLTVDATAGLTYEKILELDRNFIDADVGNDVGENFCMGISGDEHNSLMKETELISGDYTRQFVVEKGSMQRAGQYNLIKFAAGSTIVSPILDVTSAVRSCFAMSDRAMCVGMSKEMSLKVEDRPDLHETKQVVVEFDFGSVRTEGKLIQKLTATE